MRILLLPIVFTCLVGCAHVISPQVRGEVDPEVALEAVFTDPKAYEGKMVMLAGVIVSAENTEAGTYIEVVQKPMDFRGRPKKSDLSYGRFFVIYEGYLDITIYSPGRGVTVAGKVMGKKVKQIGEMEYSYLVLKSKELQLVTSQGGYPVFFSIGIFHTF